MQIIRYVTPYIAGLLMAALGVIALIVEHDKDAFLVLASAGAGMMGGGALGQHQPPGGA